MFDPRDIEARVEVYLLYKGEVILDHKLAEVLKLIEKKGSILAACRSLGIPYSRIWERIVKAERVLGIKLVEAKRGGKGGGGTVLTPEAKNVLKIYYEALSKVRPCASLLGRTPTIEKPSPELAVIGSHDPVLEHIIGILRSRGLKDIEVQWVGSLGGLASIILGEADIAGVHLFDYNTKTYNIPFIEKFLLKNEVALVKGYERELVFAMKPTLDLNDIHEIVNGLASGRLTLANRIKGAGTRVYLDYILKSYGIDSRNVKGYETEYRTHFDVASAVAMGKADICLTLRHIAHLYSLKTIHVTWEPYDFIVPLSKLNKHSVKLFFNTLKEAKSIIEKFIGYKVSKNIGEVIYT